MKGSSLLHCSSLEPMQIWEPEKRKHRLDQPWTWKGKEGVFFASRSKLDHTSFSLLQDQKLTTRVVLSPPKSKFNPMSVCPLQIKNIATGETSQAITPFHFFDNFHLFDYFHFFDNFHFFDYFTSLTIFSSLAIFTVFWVKKKFG